MTTADSTRAELGTVLGESLSSLDALQTALTDERRALEQHDTTALDRALLQKQQQVAHLARLEERRQKIVGAAGFGEDAEGMQECADWCEHGREDRQGLVERWQTYCDTARDCEQLNLANGAAIRLRQQQIADNLALLRGSERNTDTYGPTGTTTSGSGRALTEV